MLNIIVHTCEILKKNEDISSLAKLVIVVWLFNAVFNTDLVSGLILPFYSSINVEKVHDLLKLQTGLNPE